MAMGPFGAAILLLPVLPVAIWVAWSDMKFMRIPNKAVLAMAAIWPLAGWLAVPVDLWLWGFGIGAVVLVAGFVGNAAGLFGAGDAKFAAAMAQVFAGADLRVVLALFAACLLGAVATHRLARAIPAVRGAAPDWASWSHKDFPMGLALAGTVVFYLLGGFLPQG